MASKSSPVLFIHGLWLHPTSWSAWQGVFEEAGYHSAAPGWPGDQETIELARANPESVANYGIDDVVDHHASMISSMDRPPILIGHSFGGMITEKLLGMGVAAGVVAIDAAQIKGVLPLPLSSLRSTLPVFKNPANKHRSVMLTPRVPLQLRQCFVPRGIGRALRPLGSSGSGQTAVRDGDSQFHSAFTGKSGHRERDAWSASSHHGRSGPHRARSDHEVDRQAVQTLPCHHRRDGVRGPRPFSRHRRRLGGDRRCLPDLAEEPGTVKGGDLRWS